MSWSMVGFKDGTARLIGVVSGVYCKNTIWPSLRYLIDCFCTAVYNFVPQIKPVAHDPRVVKIVLAQTTGACSSKHRQCLRLTALALPANPCVVCVRTLVCSLIFFYIV